MKYNPVDGRADSVFVRFISMLISFEQMSTGANSELPNSVPLLST